jgi:Zn-finger nucleic acid-binding protein
MKCPADSATLVMSDRAGVEIDYCPECRGVWLDRGELDKILERSAGAPSPAPQQGAPRQDSYNQGGYNNQGGYKKKPSSWLTEIFD